MRRNWGFALALSALAVSGCSGLTAYKVPLADRLAGTDCQDGFRYYTPRPYVVVNRAVTVGVEQRVGLLMICGKPPAPRYFFVRAVGADGAPEDYTLEGRRLPAPVDCPIPVGHVEESEQSGIRPVQFGGQVAPLQPGGINAHLGNAQQFAMLVDNLADEAEENASGNNPFELVQLPDFEEQVAVQHSGCLSQGKFMLRFKDGWQLHSVQESRDNTDAPIRLLQVAQTALTQAASLDSARLKARGGTPAGGGSNSDSAPVKMGDDFKAMRVAIVHITKVKPGMYRLTKRSERGGDCPTGGLLSDLGIPTVVQTSVYVLSETPT